MVPITQALAFVQLNLEKISLLFTKDLSSHLMHMNLFARLLSPHDKEQVTQEIFGELIPKK